jgi:hypothetical protein
MFGVVTVRIQSMQTWMKLKKVSLLMIKCCGRPRAAAAGGPAFM